MNRIKTIRVIAKLTVVMGLLLSQTSFSAAFIKFEGIDGESKDDAHKEWIEILSVSNAALNEVPASACSRPSNPDQTVIVIEKTIDKSSPKLTQALCGGTNFYPEVEIHVHPNAGARRAPYYRYKLKNVIVSSYNISGRAEGTKKPIPIEELTLNYEEIKVSYVPEGHGKRMDPSTGR